MALKVNLRDFAVTQFLNLINLARNTGNLVVESPAEVISVSFREGNPPSPPNNEPTDAYCHNRHTCLKITDQPAHQLYPRDLARSWKLPIRQSDLAVKQIVNSGGWPFQCWQDSIYTVCKRD